MRGTILSAEISRRGLFQLTARTVMQSRVTQLVAALGRAALGVCVAYWCWLLREIVGGAFAVAVACLALKAGWDLLPFSPETRARWAWKSDLAERYPSYRFRRWLIYGVGVLAVLLWRRRDHIFGAEWVVAAWELAVPLALVVAGAIATMVWHTRHARHHVFRFPKGDLDRSDLEENYRGA
jgi:hypothetical protein